MRRTGIVLLIALAGCGGGEFEGTLRWAQSPSVSGHSLNGSLENRTSHSVALNAKGMRLLDDRGRKVAARIRVRTGDLAAGASTRPRGTWESGKPVRID